MAITTTKTKTYLTTPTQCENLKFLLTPKFYVKSRLAEKLTNFHTVSNKNKIDYITVYILLLKLLILNGLLF